MQQKANTGNVAAGVLFFVFFAVSFLTRIVFYFSIYGVISASSTDYNFFTYLFSSPLPVANLLVFIAAGICLFAKTRVGTAVCLFVLAAFAIYWVVIDAMSTSYYQGAYDVVSYTIPDVIAFVAFLIAAIICVAPKSMPKSSGFLALPGILYLVTVLFALIAVVIGLAQGYFPLAYTGAETILFDALRVILNITNDIIMGIALILTCRWAMAEFMPARAANQSTPSYDAVQNSAYAQQAVYGQPVTASADWSCPTCGRIGNGGSFCPACGAPRPQEPAAQGSYAQDSAQQPINPQGAPYATAQGAAYVSPDTGSFGWAVLGFFFPIVGLILFLVWKDTRLLSSKKAGIGALVGVIVSVVLTIVGYAAALILTAVVVNM